MGWGVDVFTIRCLGYLRVERDGAVLAPPGLSAKQRQILGILALEAGSPIAKERLADLLWDGCPPASYVGTLESYVCVLRRILGLGGGRSSLLATTSSGYRLQVGPLLSVDHVRFGELASAAMSSTGAAAVSTASEALELVGGDLLADVPYADWAVRAREVFARRVEDLGVHAAQHANGTGDHASAARFAQQVLDRDPTHELACRQLMVAHWFAGRRGQALAAYARLREATLDQVGEQPGSESYELYLAVLRDAAEPEARHRGDDQLELRSLLRLLRQALDGTPGVRAPALDAQLSAVASRLLAATT